MKKEKQPSLIKIARKAIQERLLKELKIIAGQLQKQGITAAIDFEKQAKKIAKKITKGAKTDHAATREALKEEAVDTGPIAPAKEGITPKLKTAPKTTVKKMLAPVVTPAPSAAKPVAVKAAPQKRPVKK